MVEPFCEGGGEDERLEGGADLVVAAGRVVDVLLGVVDAAVEGDDVAGGRVDGGAARADVAVGLAVRRVELGETLSLTASTRASCLFFWRVVVMR